MYDGLDFATFPIRQGWTSEKDSIAGWLQCGDEVKSRRAQLWLYFGTLSAILNVHVKPETFLDFDHLHSKSYLSSETLLDLLRQHRHALVVATTLRNGESLPTQADRVLKEVTLQNELLEFSLTDGTSDLAFVSCGISVLLQTLHAVIHAVNTSSNSKPWRLSLGKAIRARMISAGWCPHLTHVLSERYSCTALYYISGNHMQSSKSTHGHCSITCCQANHVDEDSYQPLHTTASCKCPLVGPASEHVASIISAGRIPVISCWLSSRDEMCFEVIPADVKNKFISISHVWSGGLGNLHGTAITNCQLCRLFEICGTALDEGQYSKRTSRLLSKTPTKVYFWLDTLCIPPGKQFSQVRKTSIARMSQIYSEAHRVLVLDVELQKLVFRDQSIVQILSSAVSCPWMFRCWTLQESSLSRSCYFQFADGAVSINDILKAADKIPSLRLRQSHQSSSWSVKELSEGLRSLGDVGWARSRRETMWVFRNQEIHQADAFAVTWNNFLGRSTTKLGDLHRIFAAMQDFKAAPFRDVPSDQRMRAILKGHAVLPLDLLFRSGAKQVDADRRDTWVPSFPDSGPLDCGMGYLRVYTDCLHVEAPHCVTLVFNSNLKLTTAPISIVFESDSGPQQVFIEHNLSNSAANEDNCQLDKIQEPVDGADASHCVMFARPPLRKSDRADWIESRGAMFKVRFQDDRTLHLEYRASLKVFSYDRSSPVTPPVLVIKGQKFPSNGQVFIDCDLTAWPTIPHFYTSPEGPFYEQPSGHIYLFTYLLIQLTWPISFIVIMISAPSLHIQRLPTVYSYLGKAFFAIFEMLWWRGIWQKTERLAWSQDFGVEPTNVPRYYEILNAYPSILWGARRCALMASLTTLFLAVGLVSSLKAYWARWTGFMTLLELVCRGAAQLAWRKLPETALGRLIRNKINAAWPAVRTKMMQFRGNDINPLQERVPYRLAPPPVNPDTSRNYFGVKFLNWFSSLVSLGSDPSTIQIHLVTGPIIQRGIRQSTEEIPKLSDRFGMMSTSRISLEVISGIFLVILVGIVVAVSIMVITSLRHVRLVILFVVRQIRMLRWKMSIV